MTKRNRPAEEGHNQPLEIKALKALVEDAKKIKQRQKDAGMDMLANKNRAYDLGIPRKEYNRMLKEVFNPTSQEEKDKINELLIAVRGLPLFDTAAAREYAA